MSLSLTKIYLAFAALVACSAAPESFKSSVSVGHDAEHTSLLESRNRVKPDDEPDDKPVDTPDDEPKSHEKHKHHAKPKHHGKHHAAPKHHKEKLVRKEADEKQVSVSAHAHGHKAHGKYKSLKEHNEAIEAAHKAAHQNKLDAVHQKAEAATHVVESPKEEEQNEDEEEKELEKIKTKRVGDPIKDMDKIDDDELLFTNDICYGEGVQELERYPGPVHRLLNECRQACMDDWNCFFYIYWPKDEDGKNVDGECQNNCRLYNKCPSKSSIDKEPGMSRATCQSYTFAMGETTLSKRPENSTAVQIHPIGAISSATALMASSLAWAQ